MDKEIIEFKKKPQSVISQNGDCIIPNGIEFIKDKMFEKNAKIKNLFLPESVVEIGVNSFSNCSNIKEIQFNEGLKTIENSAFDFCLNLQKVVLPQSLENLGGFAFCNCFSIKKIVFPPNLQTIPRAVCNWVFCLKEVILPKNLSCIGSSAFSGCENLTEFSFPKTLRLIQNNAFTNCASLKKIILNEGLEHIEDGAFECCKDAKELVLPNSIKKIGESVFSNCSSLKKVALPPQVAEISNFLFMNCESLEKITYSKNVKIIGNKAFKGCNSLLSFEISNNIEEIDFNAFKNCRNLSAITIPKTVRKLGLQVFSNCENIKFAVRQKNGDTFFTNRVPFGTENAMQFSNIVEFDVAKVALLSNAEFEQTIKLIAVLKDKKLSIPNQFFQNLVDENMLEKFSNELEQSNLVHFSKLQKTVSQLFNMPNLGTNVKLFSVNYKSFMLLCNNMGCFSKNEKHSQKVCNFLIDQIENKKFNFNNCMKLFSNLKIRESDEEFGNFLMEKNSETNFSNFNLVTAHKKSDVLIERINAEFANKNASIHNGRCRIDGKLKLMNFANSKKNNNAEIASKIKCHKPTFQGFLKLMEKNVFCNIENEEENQLAKSLSSTMHTQGDFDRAKEILQQIKNTPNFEKNILKNHLFKERNLKNSPSNEEIVLNFIEKTNNLKNLCENECINAFSQLKTVAQRNFSFDLIEKNDKINFLLGVYCSCCATLSGVGFGIMQKSMLDPNVQTMAVLDSNGTPVAKGTMFVNREERFCIFNNFEVSVAVSEKEMEKIFEEFVDGINQFAEKYNEENPTKPLKKINVGLNVNDLSHIIKHKNYKIDEVGLKSVSYRIEGHKFAQYVGDSNKAEQAIIWENTNLSAKKQEQERHL